MAWQRIPYWAKGMIIFGILFGPILLLNETTQFLLAPLAPIWNVAGFHFLSGWINSLVRGADQYLSPNLLAKIILVSIYVLVGAVLGFLWGAMKEKDRSAKLW